MNNKVNCPSCGASIDAGVQVCPVCGSQVYVQQPVQQPMMQQQPMQQPMMQQQPMQQPVMYDPNTGQPIQQGMPQPINGAPMGQMVNPNQEEPKTKLYIALGVIILGYFVAGIICAMAALSLGLSYKGKSPLKIVVLVLAGLELGLMVLYLGSLIGS
ncbi:MAG: zinc-ribbon domain-containing protein [Bacilli bacterium]|nr:zinc-ribbon domain-containing protein [Bacilli bacterium]